jgi:hypothetical protein
MNRGLHSARSILQSLAIITSHSTLASRVRGHENAFFTTRCSRFCNFPAAPSKPEIRPFFAKIDTH